MQDYLVLLTHRATIEERQRASARAAMYAMYGTEHVTAPQRLARLVGRGCLWLGGSLLRYGRVEYAEPVSRKLARGA